MGWILFAKAAECTKIFRSAGAVALVGDTGFCYFDPGYGR
jgi:hypothetical protein